MIEICANSLQSAINAQLGGAGRVELCDNLYEGGTTPSAATIVLARKHLTIKLHVLIRPRGGDFLYSPLEMETIKQDILFCKNAGCDGVVLGFLNADGTVDMAKTREMIALARPMSVTFHRAFDMTPDAMEALQQIISLGTDRILTSGQKNKAPQGTALLKKLVAAAADKIIIMPGSGINATTIAAMQKNTGAKEFHLSGQKATESMMEYRKEDIFLGGLSQIPEYKILQSDPNIIKNVVALHNLHIAKKTK